MLRKLKDGTTVPELAESVTLVVKTKCPDKWLLTDLETGEQYLGQAGKFYSWRKITNDLDADQDNK